MSPPGKRAIPLEGTAELPQAVAILESFTDRFIALDVDWRIIYINIRGQQFARDTSREQLLGRYIWDVFPDAADTIFEHKFREAAEKQVKVSFEAFYLPNDAWYAIRIYPSKEGMSIYYNDITERKNAETQLEARVAERTKELSLLLKVSHIVGSTLEFEPLLNTILEQLKTVVDYSGAAIYSIQEDRLTMLDYVGPLPVAQMEQLWKFYERSAFYQQLRQKREAIIVDDLHDNMGFAEAYRKVVGEREDRGLDQQFHSWMVIPLLANERFIGLLTLSHSRPNYYTPDHSRLAFAIANQAAVALENAYLYKRAQELAVLQERQRLARELHDSVSQELYGISLSAHAAREALETEPTESIAALEHVMLHADVGLNEMRALLFELRPELLETEGLAAALNKRVEVLRARYNLAIDVEVKGEPDIAIEGKHALFRIAQEALHNVTKHARASKVTLRLTQEKTELALEVRDNGTGFDPACDFTGHFGLRSMHERVASLNGTIAIESAVGKGTTVCARIPRIN